MVNILSYIVKLLANEKNHRLGPGANNLIKVSVEDKSVTGDGRTANRNYNKNNLWIAFNKYDFDVTQPDKTDGGYSFKSHNEATLRRRDNLKQN